MFFSFSDSKKGVMGNRKTARQFIPFPKLNFAGKNLRNNLTTGAIGQRVQGREDERRRIRAKTDDSEANQRQLTGRAFTNGRNNVKLSF
jgi:hypothetical protein